ncbi:MAG TPA: hypothetical protein VK573_12905, partial [Gemmatimonadales bacterium]|nr:hypothetical protein [Gemmatimonadales bacterium]
VINASALGLQVVPSTGRVGGHIVVSGGGVVAPGGCGEAIAFVEIDGYPYGTGTFRYGLQPGASGFTQAAAIGDLDS